MPRELKTFLNKIIESGYQLSPEAYRWLQKHTIEEIEALSYKAISRANNSIQDLFVLDVDFFKSLTEKEKPKSIDVKSIKQPLAEKVKADFEILDHENANPSGDVEGFVDYFRSRFNVLNTILRKRVDARDSITITRARNMPLKSEFKTIGIVTDKRNQGRRLFLEIEDLGDSITVMASDNGVVRDGLLIQRDQVICIESIKYKEDLFIAKKFIWPDIPTRKPRRSTEPICAAFLSDVHIGSNFFRDDLFNRFLDWLNRDIGNKRHQDLASRVKYIVIAGDLVDGVGIYPEQLEELNITDIRDQYEKAYEFLEKIPKYMEIIIIPGNHDAVRRSIPQPVIPKIYAPSLHDDPRIHLYENPCKLNLNGVEVLVDHGKALDDILSSTPGQDFHKPVEGMEILLKTRHLSPSYGLTTPIAPEKMDRLVIKTVPDVLLMGHIHIYDIKKYKGVTLICSGSFQDRTPFQKRRNIHPTTGIVNIFDLQTHQNYRLDLNQFM